MTRDEPRAAWIRDAARDLAPALIQRAEHITDTSIEWAARHSVALATGIHRHATIPAELHDLEEYHP